MSTTEPELPGDADRRGEADARHREGAGLDVDAAFADLVARFGEAPPRVGSWPAQEDLDPEAASAEPTGDAAQEVRAGRGGAAAGADGEGWTPPELPPVARGSWWSALPWVGVLGAPLFFLVVVLAHLALPDAVLITAVAAFVAGFVALVARLPAHHDDDEDGAVV